MGKPLRFYPLIVLLAVAVLMPAAFYPAEPHAGRRVKVVAWIKYADVDQEWWHTKEAILTILRAEGVDAVTSYTFDDDGVEPTEAAIRAVIKQADASFVLVTHVAGSVEKSQYFPAVGATFVDAGYYGGLYSYYPRVYNYVYMPAQTFSKEIVTLETGLYDAGNSQLIWIGRSDAVNPEMTKKYYISLTKLFVRDLACKAQHTLDDFRGTNDFFIQ